MLEINKRKEKHLHISTTIGSIIRFSAKAYQNGLSPLEKEMTCRNRKGWASTNRMKPVTGLSVSRENESAISLLVNKPCHPVNESEFVIIHSSRELLRGIRRPPKQQQTNKPTNQHVPCLSTRLCFHFINVPEKKKRNLSPLVVLRSATGGIYLHTPSSPNVGDVWRTTKSIAQLSVIQPVILSISHIFLDDKS